MRYRKKPVVIEAVSVLEAHQAAMRNWSAMPDWLRQAYQAGDILFFSFPTRVHIRTLEGLMTADRDDMIICGVKGEIYACKPDIFAATYDKVDDVLAS